MDPLSFEESLARLDEIVQQLDQGRLDLQTSLNRYEEGIRHLARCHEILENAQQRIQILRGLDKNGHPVLEEVEIDSIRSDENVPGRQSKNVRKSEPRSRKQNESATPDEPGNSTDTIVSPSQNTLF